MCSIGAQPRARKSAFADSVINAYEIQCTESAPQVSWRVATLSGRARQICIL